MKKHTAKELLNISKHIDKHIAFCELEWQKETSGMKAAELFGYCKQFLKTISDELSGREDWTHLTHEPKETVSDPKPFDAKSLKAFQSSLNEHFPS